MSVPEEARVRSGAGKLMASMSAWIDRRAVRRSPRVERLLLALAVAVFTGAALAASRHLPHAKSPSRWMLLALVALVGGPATVILNTAEYRVSARALGHRVRWLEAARVSVIGSAANQLPIPGSVLVRVRALRQLGSSYRKASASTAILAFAWIGTTGVMAGGFLLASGPRGLGVGLLVAGLVALIVAYVMLRGQVVTSRARLLMLQALAVEAGSVVVTAFRLYGILFALGFSVSVAQAMALTISAVVSSAVGVFPGGLGIRELTAAAIGPLVGLPAAAAFLATAVDRVAMLIVLSMLSLLLIRRGFPTESPAQEPRSEKQARSLSDSSPERK